MASVHFEADQIIVLNEDYHVFIYNKDASSAEMCANGLRCLAHWLEKPCLSFTTPAGTYVGMCTKPNWAGVLLPVPVHINPVVECGLNGIFLNTGVPHTVFFESDIPLEVIGPLLHHKTNVSTVHGWPAQVRVWERGAGPTGSCGTAAGAIFAAGRRFRQFPDSVCLTFPGGVLEVRAVSEDTMLVEGPVTVEREGVVELESS